MTTFILLSRPPSPPVTTTYQREAGAPMDGDEGAAEAERDGNAFSKLIYVFIIVAVFPCAPSSS